MKESPLHALVQKRDLLGIRKLLQSPSPPSAIDINATDQYGITPLMHAVADPSGDVEIVRLLLAHGARADQEGKPTDFSSPSPIVRALRNGNPQVVIELISAGADLHYRSAHGYDALLDAVHGRDILQDPHLIDLLKLLIEKGVSLSSVSSYKESGLRTLSRIGRFDGVQVLLQAGADSDHLKWTPLIQAVAIGSSLDIEQLIQTGVALEDKDWWERTAWLVSIQTGNIAKAEVLRKHGAATNARGRCGKPPLFYAIETNHPHMLTWLLELGLDVEQTDEFEATPLMTAVENSNLQCVNILLNAGAEVDKKHHARTPLNQATSPDIAKRLLDAGADPSYLSYPGHRALLGYAPEPDIRQLDVSPEQFLTGRNRRFGNRNPEEIQEPFWVEMIRSGATGYQGNQVFSGPSSFEAGPVWCAQRFGQSITFLPDSRIVQVGGEHEDSYDPDFCIYNDVFVHEPGGSIRMFGYPESVFPPTDFHTATLVGNQIYLIGSLGYHGSRRFGHTPIFRLNTETFRIERIEVSGEGPGWIHSHRATLSSPHEIRIDGGILATEDGQEESLVPNTRSFVLNLESLTWHVQEGP